MKTIITFFTIISFVFVNKTQETLTINATFDGYEEGFYYFTDEEDNSYFFESINKEVLEKYNLLEEEFVGKEFEVTYKIETKTDEFDEEYDSYSILKLQLLEE